jgi:hypothetical protein
MDTTTRTAATAAFLVATGIGLVAWALELPVEAVAAGSSLAAHAVMGGLAGRRGAPASLLEAVVHAAHRALHDVAQLVIA